ncbi:MAG: putative rane protein ArfC, partial [Mycobacterium sp.]|nr:putative rane protein ArfC [Mycobacterium sp.]
TGSGSAGLDLSTAKVPKVSGGGAVTTGAAGVVGGAAAAKLVGSGGDSEPYGAGSLRLAGGAAAPSGYAIKGNEDSMLYHTTDSPSYQQTIAEVWFRDESTAERAGFTRWDKDRA